MNLTKIIILLFVLMFSGFVTSEAVNEESISALMQKLGISDIRENTLKKIKPILSKLDQELVEESWESLELELENLNFEQLIKVSLQKNLSENDVKAINLFLESPAGQKKNGFTESELKALDEFNNSIAGKKLTKATLEMIPVLIEQSNNWLQLMAKKNEEAQKAYQNSLEMIESETYLNCSEDNISSIVGSNDELFERYQVYFDSNEELTKFIGEPDYRVRLEMYEITLISLDKLLESKYLVEKKPCYSKIIDEIQSDRSFLLDEISYINEALESGKLEQPCNEYEVDDILAADEELREIFTKLVLTGEAVKNSDKSNNLQLMIKSREEDLLVLHSVLDSVYIKKKKKCYSEIISFNSENISFLESEISKLLKQND